MRALVLLVLAGCPKSSSPAAETASATATASDTATATATATAAASAAATATATATATTATASAVPTIAMTIAATSVPTAFPLPPLRSCTKDDDCTLVHLDHGCCPVCAGEVGNRTWAERVNSFCATQKVKCRPMACSYLEAIPKCKAGNCS